MSLMRKMLPKQTGGGSEEMRPVEPNAMEEILDDDLDQVSGGASHHAPSYTQHRTSPDYITRKYMESTPGAPKASCPKWCYQCNGTNFRWYGGVPHFDYTGTHDTDVQIWICNQCGEYYGTQPNSKGGYYATKSLGHRPPSRLTGDDWGIMTIVDY